MTGAGGEDLKDRDERKLKKLILACVDVAAKELLHSALEEYATGNEKGSTVESLDEGTLLLSPESTKSSANVLATPETPMATAVDDVVTPTVDQEVIVVDEDEGRTNMNQRICPNACRR